MDFLGDDKLAAAGGYLDGHNIYAFERIPTKHKYQASL